MQDDYPGQFPSGPPALPEGADADGSLVDTSDIAPVPRITIQAFCESQALSEAVQEASRDRRMAKAHVRAAQAASLRHWNSTRRRRRRTC